MPTMNTTPAAAFYAGLPYLVRLALACEESEDFLLSDTFLEASTAEEGLRRHIELDAALADKYGLGDPDAIWRAFAARDISRIISKLLPYRRLMAATVVISIAAIAGPAAMAGTTSHPTGSFCYPVSKGLWNCSNPGDDATKAEPRTSLADPRHPDRIAGMPTYFNPRHPDRRPTC